MSRWTALQPLARAKSIIPTTRLLIRTPTRSASSANTPRPATRPGNSSGSNNGASQRPQYARYTPGMGSFALYIVSLASALTAGYFISPLSQGMSAQPFAPHLITSTEATELQKLNQPRYGTHPDYLAAIKELETIFSDKEGRVSTDKEDLEAHGISDWSYHEAKMPTVVVWAESTDEVKKVVDIARKYKVPITPFSGGTSLEGHFSSPYGGISLDLSLMDKVLHVSEADGDCIVQSGVKWEDVNAYLADKGIKMFFPLDPGPGATIGGMVGTGCSGTNAVRYGTAKAEWFLNLTVVLPSGEIIKTRQRARKSSAGWDTTKLFVGAEGTLGIVTEATLRLAPLLPTKVAVVGFPGVEEAVGAATEIVNLGMPVQCVEFLDKKTVQAVNEGGLAGRKFPLQDSLFFKFQGSDSSMTEVAKKVKEVAAKHGGANLEFSRTDKEAHDLWQGRKAALWSIMGLVPGSKAWTTDVCVPISRLPQLVRETSEDFEKRGIVGAHLGHVGDGNVHSILLFTNDDELHRIEEGVHEMVHRAIRLDGTCTGEHGVGLGKIEYLTEELGLGTVNLMETVKRTIDPLNIMNPGKLYPHIRPIKP